MTILPTVQIILTYGGVALFGVVVGWLLYYVNRHRTGDVSLADFGSTLVVLVGPAIFALLAKAGDDPAIFGAYGLGLFVGFFAYYRTLRALVSEATDQFDSLFFLDGRRLVPHAKYDLSGQKPDRTATVFGMPRMRGTSAPLTARTSTPDFKIKIDQSIKDVKTAIADLEARRQAEPDSGKGDKMQAQKSELSLTYLELQAQALILETEKAEVKAAAKNLGDLAGSLSETAGEIKTATNVIAQATRVIDAANALLSLMKTVA